VTCSALQHVLFPSAAHIREHAPYQIYRFKPGPAGFAPLPTETPPPAPQPAAAPEPAAPGR
jgi:hypothetical protein